MLETTLQRSVAVDNNAQHELPPKHLADLRRSPSRRSPRRSDACMAATGDTSSILRREFAQSLDKMTALQASIGASMQEAHDAEVRELSQRLQALRSSHATDKAAFTSLLTALSKTATDIQAQLHQLTHHEAKRDAWDQRVATKLQHAESTIKLNVGGRYFETAKANLLRQPETYFTAMLASDLWAPRADGAYFIDADPAVFEHIMVYLRGDEMAFDAMSHAMAYRVLGMLDYFGLDIAMWQLPTSAVDLGLERRRFDLASTSWQPVHVRSEYPSIRYSVQLIERSTLCSRRPPVDANRGLRRSSTVNTKPPFSLRIGFSSSTDPSGYGTEFQGEAFEAGDVLTVTFHKPSNTVQYLLNGTDVPSWTTAKGVVWGPGLLFPCVVTNLPLLQMAFVS
ncbi:hypothetical protein SDRG_16203 [Saprolegnia diclina VS20]|uniref:Potassium channel tetramerisation-type BTB domain-containing protein n=1 Tax=Saprolegnia diclina (strain VS20) TaxID=1156394 RepID=T0PUQ9_SAPDV|nr:hypothetical protein SDRG_16203 [Saprolegnia diclina VS20]EQC25946.1 hypothetical protein SDRG_16203 [Saprolegnia diclina VS20]|eukprot:XP_008620626.1 hypothetical protein SDRG_16203 [Saprolegnia diclina VS20]